jgi:Rieske Fe-S protein
MGTQRRLILLSTCAAVAGCQAGAPATPAPSKTRGSPAPLRPEDIPVGGGVLVDVGAGVIVTRPTETTLQGYSAVCPHEGCIVTAVERGEMVCPCHGSRFRISDGEVTRGPAKRGLDPVSITLANGFIHIP